jgi:hypothetical protein
MDFSEIGYRGNYVEIAPSYRLITESNLFMMATSYGNPMLTEKIFDECEREYLSANQDFDVTSPFPKLTCLDGISNRIYTTLLFLNDYIYSNYNKNNYSEGFEFLILQKVNQKIYWAQIGWPHMFILSQKKLLGIDHSLGQRPIKSSKGPNLPHSLLGLSNSLNFRVESSIIRPNEEIIFVKSESLPSDFYNPNQISNEGLIKSLYKNSPTTGAWLGRLSFSAHLKAEDSKAQSL